MMLLMGVSFVYYHMQYPAVILVVSASGQEKRSGEGGGADPVCP